jgi:ATP-dependent Lon protease
MNYSGKETKYFLNDIIKQFTKDSSVRTFENFLAYFYAKIEDKLKQTKQQSIKDKYIKIRQSALQYIIANKNTITIEICKKRNTKK